MILHVVSTSTKCSMIYPRKTPKLSIASSQSHFPSPSAQRIITLVITASAAFVLSAAAIDETLSNIPQTFSSECAPENKDCKRRYKIQRPKSKKAETCTSKCVTTCVRGGLGSSGEGPFNVRRFLAEIGALKIFTADDTPLPLSDLYENLTEEKSRCGCSWESFEVYRHLKSQGYIIGRHGVPWSLKSIKFEVDDQNSKAEADGTRDERLGDDGISTEMFNNMKINQTGPLFDVFSPNSKFKKSSPGNPLFVLFLMSDQPPSNKEVKELEACCEGTPLKVSIVEQGRISFFDFTNVELSVLP